MGKADVVIQDLIIDVFKSPDLFKAEDVEELCFKKIFVEQSRKAFLDSGCDQEIHIRALGQEVAHLSAVLRIRIQIADQSHYFKFNRIHPKTPTMFWNEPASLRPPARPWVLSINPLYYRILDR